MRSHGDVYSNAKVHHRFDSPSHRRSRNTSQTNRDFKKVRRGKLEKTSPDDD